VGVSETARRFELQMLKAEFFKALGHPTRVRILEILRHGQRSVQELQQALRLDQSIVSQHLAILRAKNVVDTRRQGTTVRYTVRDAAVGELLDVARRIFGRHLEDSRSMLAELRREQRGVRRR
jgi:DNA-binding transcriptional ArsR family regulator